MLCLMTGTAADRAVGTHKVDGYICTTYFDMLVDKLVEKPTFSSSRIMSKYRVADNMDEIPGVKFYQYDLSELFSEANDLNPSHNKWIEEPAKAEAHVKTTLGDLFATKYASGLYPSIREVIGEKITGVMMFIPRNTKTGDDEIMDTILAQIGAVSNEEFHIIELTGRTTTGKKAEDYTKDEIKKANKQNKIPLIISAGHIGSRSFSIPEINVTILMYDGGSASTTGQNMSRSQTRGLRLDKVGHVISISVDPTRDDSMVEAVLESAIKKANKNGDSIIESMKTVLRSINLHALNKNREMVLANPDEYAAMIMKSSSLRKVVGATSNPEYIMDNPEAIQKLLAMTGEEVSLGKAESIGNKGKTFAANDIEKAKLQDKNDDEEKEALALWNKIRSAMKLIADNVQNVAAIGDSDHLTDALDNIINSAELTNVFEYSFNIDPLFVKELIDIGAVNGKLLDLIVYTYNNEQIQESEQFLAEFA